MHDVLTNVYHYLTGLAKQSVSFCCPRCGPTAALLPEPKEGEEAKESKPRFAKEIEKLQMLQAVNEIKNKGKSDEKSSESEGEKTEEEVAPLVEENASEPAATAPATTPAPPAPVAAAATTNTSDAAPAAEQPANTEPEVAEEFADAAEPQPAAPGVDWSFCTERFVNNSIAIMSLLLYLLWRKGCALFSEIQEINQQLQQPL